MSRPSAAAGAAAAAATTAGLPSTTVDLLVVGESSPGWAAGPLVGLDPSSGNANAAERLEPGARSPSLEPGALSLEPGALAGDEDERPPTARAARERGSVEAAPSAD